MGAYTTFLSVDVIGNFFDDCPNQRDNVEEAKRVFKKFDGPGLPSGREAIRRANLDECEFLAVLILMFWYTDCLQMRDEIVRIGERYKQEVLRELQAYYRDVLKLENYAVRIGELFMLILNCDRSSDMDEQYDIYRLLGVFSDDTFVYRLHSRAE